MYKLIYIFVVFILFSCGGSRNHKLHFNREEAEIIKSPGSVKEGDFKNSRISFSRIVEDKSKLHVYLHVINPDSTHLNGLKGDIMDITRSSIKKKYALDTVTITGFNVMNITNQVCEPVSLMFSIDRSGSMIQNAEKTRNAAISFVRNKYSDDEIGIVVFGTWAKSESKLTTNADHLVSTLYGIDLKEFSGTNFNAGINKAINSVRLQAHYNKKGIILLSDGYGMSAGQANKLINRARKMGVAINFLQYHPYNLKQGKELKISEDDAKMAQRIASATGGIYKTISEESDFEKEFHDIRYKYCNVYKVTIDKPNLPGEYVYTFKFNDGCLQKGFELGVNYTYSDLTVFHAKNIGTWVYPMPVLKCDTTQLIEPEETAIDTITEPQVGDIFLLNVYFDFDKSILKKESDDAVQQVYELMSEYPNMKIELRGHTDNRGEPDYNKRLSLNRCISVKKALVKKGISTGRIQVKGFGQSSPVATNETPEGRALNRRTEFKILER